MSPGTVLNPQRRRIEKRTRGRDVRYFTYDFWHVVMSEKYTMSRAWFRIRIARNIDRPEHVFTLKHADGGCYATMIRFVLKTSVENRFTPSGFQHWHIHECANRTRPEKLNNASSNSDSSNWQPQLFRLSETTGQNLTRWYGGRRGRKTVRNLSRRTAGSPGCSLSVLVAFSTAIATVRRAKLCAWKIIIFPSVARLLGKHTNI